MEDIAEMRKFEEADKTRKKQRIQIPENPANLSKEKLSVLENEVKVSLREGYLSCPAAWKIAKNHDVPRIAVGAIADRMGVRITDCQIGCFKVDKTAFSGENPVALDEGVTSVIANLDKEGRLTCENVFSLAKKHHVSPMALGNEASARNNKVGKCQLGCF